MFIMVLLMGIAIPSVSGVLAERRLRASLDAFGDLAALAQRRSVAEGKTFLLARDPKGQVRLCPEDLSPKARRELAPAALPAGTYRLELPNVLPAPGKRADPTAAADEWAFWPTGTCEPAVVRFEGAGGIWEATFNPLTARAAVTRFQPKS